MRVHVIASLLFLSSCSGSQAKGPTAPAEQAESLPVLTSMTVALSAASVQVGQNVTATIAAFDEKGRSMTVGVTEWTSSRPSVASVSADGVVAAHVPGQATIIARVGTVQGQAAVSVTPLPPGPAPVATVSVSPLTLSLMVAQSRQLSAAVRDYAGNDLADREVMWMTSDPAVATVSPQGLVTALAAGTAIIEASSESRRGAVAMAVTAATDTEIVVTVPTPAPQTVVGDTMTVNASVRSLFPIERVVASVGGQARVLVYGAISGVGPKGAGDPPMGWSAVLDLSSLPFGPYALVVTATDNRGHRGVTAVPFVRNPRVPGGSKAPPGSK